MIRQYKMRRRAEARDQTRERIMQATMQLHDEKGISATTFSDIAKRAGVGPATVSRHFPALGDLIQACGVHVWMEMRPPVPEAAAAVFEGLESTSERLARLVEELDGFYARSGFRLRIAARDRDTIPEVHGFFTAVDAGIEALVREALAASGEPETAVQTVIALTALPVWTALDRLGLPAPDLAKLKVRLLHCAIAAARGA